MTDAPKMIALRWQPGAAVTSGPLMDHPDYTRYVRQDMTTHPIEQADDAVERELTDMRAKLVVAVEAIEACVASLERADTTEGVCCCGDSMEQHSDPMWCGHSPVDMGTYYAAKAIEAAHAALAQIKGDE